MKKILILLFLMIISAGNIFSSDTGVLFFGAARIDITPDYIVPLAGYPGYRLSNGVHDHIYCRASVFELNGQRLVFVSCDLIGFSSDLAGIIKKKLSEKYQLKSDEILISATHNHNSPVLALERSGDSNTIRFTLSMIDAVTEGVSEALKNMEPVTVSAGKGFSPIGVNRRVFKANTYEFPNDGGMVKLGRNPDGPVDHEISVINFMKKNNDIKGCFYSYSCHARSFTYSNKLITGDFFGFADLYIEKMSSKGMISFPFAGASGDIDPVFIRYGFPDNKEDVSESELMGSLLGREIIDVIIRSEEIKDIKKIGIETALLKLPAKNYNEYVTDESLPQKELSISVASIGDIAFICIGAEVLTEIGLRIKRASPFKYNVIITNCNSSSGYLPLTEIYKERGYEVSSSRFGPGSSELVINQTLKMLYNQYDK